MIANCSKWTAFIKRRLSDVRGHHEHLQGRRVDDRVEQLSRWKRSPSPAARGLERIPLVPSRPSSEHLQGLAVDDRDRAELRRSTVSGAALVQRGDRLRDPSLTVSSSGSLDRGHVPSLLLLDNASNVFFAFASFLSAAAKSFGTLDHAGRRVELDVDVDHVAAGDLGPGAVLGADSDHEPAAHRGDRVPVREPVDGDADRRPFPGAEALDHGGRDLEAGRRLACLLERGAEPHAGAFIAKNSFRTGAKIVGSTSCP